MIWVIEGSSERYLKFVWQIRSLRDYKERKDWVVLSDRHTEKNIL